MLPPCRLNQDAVIGQADQIAADRQLAVVVETIPGPAMVLNDRRQILAANRMFCEVVGVPDASAVLGKRPGDAIGCIEAAKGPDGCGSAEACRVCGAGMSLTRLERGEPTPIRDECRISRMGKHGVEAFDLACGISRLPDSGHTLLVMSDISGEKRLRALERVFFHDVLNTAGGLSTLIELAQAGDAKALEMVGTCSNALVEEIRHQQVLLAAEHGELLVQLASENVAEICTGVVELYRRHPASERRLIQSQVEPQTILTDRILLRRVLGNLLKNALEATPAGGVVSLSTQRSGRRLRILVHNPGAMSSLVRMQVFKRSFSTKGEGRGLGTYSVQLFTESYLGGQVGFTSEAASGTTFWCELPIA